MSHVEIFALYLVAHLILLVWLLFGVIRIRRANRISLGHAERQDLLQAQRAHGNFAENAPFMLIAMMAIIQLGTSTLMLHVVGATFLIGRVLHAIGIRSANHAGKARQLGMVLTVLGYAIAIIYLIVLVIQSRGSYGLS